MTKLNQLYSLLTLSAIIFCCLSACSDTSKSIDNFENRVVDKATQSADLDLSGLASFPERKLYFGDLHVHTTLSIDAYVGGTLTSAEQAYQFAKGETIEVMGKQVKLVTPLDFAAVTDHAEALGEMFSIHTPGAPGHNSIVARYLRSIFKTKSDLGVDTNKQRKIFNRVMKQSGKDAGQSHPGFFGGFETTMSAWNINLEAAESHYTPGHFTTFAGYEWTHGGGYQHIHRNLIFRDMIVPEIPMSAFELTDEEQLWNWMKSITELGATVMAIPHNSNLSGGGTFTSHKPNGEPIDSAYAQLRQDFEPLVEVHQAKGNSEVHSHFWKNDEFADFENYSSIEPKEEDYLRYALKKGLEHDEHLGINPFKYGMIGSTDSHNGTPGNTEENDEYIGNNSIIDMYPKGRREAGWALDPTDRVYQVLNPGGLVAVWAEANSREHIYDALYRKETYATSGTRIELRVFSGYDFDGTYSDHDVLIEDGYAKGKPMGSDIEFLAGRSPELLIWAKRAIDGANLDRVQVIKGWYAHGEMHEKIFTVALSDDRVLNDDGNVPDNGARVNLKTGAWSTDKGSDVLTCVWVDEEFDPEVRCFYYVRVLELPTASWRLWDQIRHGVQYPEDAELTIRERAWSSPVWYRPECRN